MSAAKARQMGVRYSSAAVTVNSSVKKSPGTASVSAASRPVPRSARGAGAPALEPFALVAADLLEHQLLAGEVQHVPVAHGDRARRPSSPLTKGSALAAQVGTPSSTRLRRAAGWRGRARRWAPPARRRPSASGLLLHSQWLTGCLSPVQVNEVGPGFRLISVAQHAAQAPRQHPQRQQRQNIPSAAYYISDKLRYVRHRRTSKAKVSPADYIICNRFDNGLTTA